MAVRNKIGYSLRTFGATKPKDILAEVMKSAESNPQLRAEIRKTFQRANRRIQNIEAAGLLSPAVTALNKGDIKGFTKFSMALNWDDLKLEYGKAIGFLRQPTSTATGSREYGKFLQKTYSISDDEFVLMKDRLQEKMLTLSDSQFVDRYLMRYKDFTGELEREAKDVSAQIESDAVSIRDAIDRDIEQQAQEISEGVNRIIKAFESFKM